MLDFTAARVNMVNGQVRPNRVTDQGIIDALSQIPRERFVPKAARGYAYVDENLPIGRGRYLLEPMVFARLLQGLDICRDDVVLDVGSGTGYSAAVLAQLAGTVVALESDTELSKDIPGHLRDLSIDNVVVETMALEGGCLRHAPYSVIVIEGAVTEIPAALIEQLGEGGRLAAVVSGRAVGTARLFQRIGGSVSSRPLFDATTPMLPGFEAKPRFIF